LNSPKLLHSDCTEPRLTRVSALFAGFQTQCATRICAGLGQGSAEKLIARYGCARVCSPSLEVNARAVRARLRPCPMTQGTATSDPPAGTCFPSCEREFSCSRLRTGMSIRQPMQPETTKLFHLFPMISSLTSVTKTRMNTARKRDKNRLRIGMFSHRCLAIFMVCASRIVQSR
jgi:hypothetical protein